MPYVKGTLGRSLTGGPLCSCRRRSPLNEESAVERRPRRHVLPPVVGTNQGRTPVPGANPYT